MGFICNKTRIIDLALTPMGVELLSKGIFLPKYFTLHDTDVIYNSASDDFSVESLPVFEVFQNVSLFSQSYTSNPFISQYVDIQTNVTGSLSISRLTDENAESDTILNLINEQFLFGDPNAISPESRIESLKNLGNIIDTNSMIQLRENYSNNKPQFLVRMYISGSDGIHALSVSGSDFGISEDLRVFFKSSEYSESDNFYSVVKMVTGSAI